jgi:hypothetical protein
MKIYTKEWYYKTDKTEEDFLSADRKYQEFLVCASAPEDLRNSLNFHDAVVKELLFEQGVLVLTFDVSGSGSTVTKVEFLGAQIQINDGIHQGDWWLYEEVYRFNEQYELHVLFCDLQGKAKELTVLFQEVVLEHNEEKREKQQALRKFLNMSRGPMSNKTGDGSLDNQNTPRQGTVPCLEKTGQEG